MALEPTFTLANYVRVGRYDLPEPTRTTPPSGSLLAQEASAVTYNSDTDTLFVVGDGGTSVVQISKRNVSTTLIQPGSEFKLGYKASLGCRVFGHVRHREPAVPAH